MNILLDRHEADPQAAYRLRYEVFTVEGGDERYADHRSRTYTDQDDGPPTRLVIAWDEAGRAAGTLRLSALRDRVFIAHELYAFEQLAGVLTMKLEDLLPRVMRVDRGVVEPTWRGQGLIDELFAKSREYAHTRDCCVFVGTNSPENHRARRANARLGWREYAQARSHQGFLAQPIYLDLRATSGPPTASDR